ncbi:transaldolase family protein [Methylocystis sp.]|uniref:transaldolase family protein n=1 Tax=Methylocystis sp. TaxID=1911079 RepID=UPI002734951E|nr:transaldolase family protein [Methylocystis sp.]MDP3553703.1 transaldolase family protein [Methylocystis sp.]
MLLVDTADQNAILNALKFPGVQGFTTNPALMARAAGAEALSLDEYVAAARKLCAMSADIGAIRQLMIQAVGSADDALRQAACYLDDLKTAREKKLWIKLAPTAPSLACCQALKDIGCASLATAVFTAAQAYVAMEAGADGVAVYLGRLMRHERDWEKQIESVAAIVKSAERTLLLASFPDRQTVEVGLRYSRDITAPPSVLDDLLTSSPSQKAIKAFDEKIASER